MTTFLFCFLRTCIISQIVLFFAETTQSSDGTFTLLRAIFAVQNIRDAHSHDNHHADGPVGSEENSASIKKKRKLSKKSENRAGTTTSMKSPLVPHQKSRTPLRSLNVTSQTPKSGRNLHRGENQPAITNFICSTPSKETATRQLFFSDSSNLSEGDTVPRFCTVMSETQETPLDQSRSRSTGGNGNHEHKSDHPYAKKPENAQDHYDSDNSGIEILKVVEGSKGPENENVRPKDENVPLNEEPQSADADSTTEPQPSTSQNLPQGHGAHPIRAVAMSDASDGNASDTSESLLGPGTSVASFDI